MKKQPINLFDLPPTNATAIGAIRNAERYLWDDFHDRYERDPSFEESQDWLLWYGDPMDQLMTTFHRIKCELYEEYKREKTASQPAAK